MKRLISLLVCMVLMLSMLGSATASEGSGLQILDYRVTEKELEVILYARAGSAVFEKDFALKLGETDVPVSSLSGYEEGTSWILVLEPTRMDADRKMIVSLVERLISGFKDNDRITIFNSLSGDSTEWLTAKNDIISAVNRTIKHENGDIKLYDTIRSAVNTVETDKTIGIHKSMLVISQCIDQGSSNTIGKISDAISAQSLTVYAVGLTGGESTRKNKFAEWSAISSATQSGLSFEEDKSTEENGIGVAKKIQENEKNFYVLSALLESIPQNTPVTDTTISVTLQKNTLQLTAISDHVNIELPEAILETWQDHEHEWEDATCVLPKTCKICGETEGEPLGHDFSEATCTEPKICKVCGVTEGEPLGHDFVGTSFFSEGTCSRCGEKEKSGLENLIDTNPILVGMAALLLVLLLVLIVVLIRKSKEKNKENPGGDTTVDPDIGGETKSVKPRLTVELTEKKTGKKYIGKMFGTSIKAGLQGELKLEGDSSISRKQMEFIWEHGILYVQDMNSKNGTRVNGELIDKAVSLHHNDIIHVGETDFIVNWYSN